MNNQHEVFISYSSKDSNIASHLVNLIEAKGVKCWFAERDIPAGTPNWEQAITDAIHSAKVFVVIISKNSVSSTQIPREIRLAVNFCEAIYPVRIDNVELQGSFEYYLAGYQWTDVTVEQREKLEKFSDIISRFLQGNTDGQNMNILPAVNDISNALSNDADNKKSPKRMPIVIAIAICIIAGVILFGVLNNRGNKSAEVANDDNISTDIETAPDDNTSEDSPTLIVPESILSQKESTETMYSELSSVYEEMLASTSQPVDMTQYLPNIVNTDIDNDGVEDAFLFTKSEEGYDGNVEIQLSSGATLSWSDMVSKDSDGWVPGADPIAPVDICAVDIDDDGVCEVLFKQEFGGTGGILSNGYICKYSSGTWNILPINLSDNMFDKVTDIQLVKDGTIALMDYGMKDGPFQWRDYEGIKCVIAGLHIQQIEKNKAIAKEYWPFEDWTLDSGNYEEQDFTVTDDVIAQLKEELEIPSNVYVTVTVSGIFYYDRRDVYLKQILFRGDGIYESVYIDKQNNQIDFNRY